MFHVIGTCPKVNVCLQAIVLNLEFCDSGFDVTNFSFLAFCLIFSVSH